MTLQLPLNQKPLRKKHKLNADINGAGNVIRKVAPDAFSEARAVEDGKASVLHSLVVHPVRIVVPRRTQKTSNSVSKRSRESEKTL